MIISKKPVKDGVNDDVNDGVMPLIRDLQYKAFQTTQKHHKMWRQMDATQPKKKGSYAKFFA